MDLTAAIWAGMMEKVDLEQGSLRWSDGRSLESVRELRVLRQSTEWIEARRGAPGHVATDLSD